MSEEIVGNTMPSLCTRLPRRIKLSELQLEKVTLEDLIHSWHDQDLYIDALESQASSLEADMASLRESEERMRQQHLESTHREKVLVRRLASKEQEMQEYASQISEFKAGQTAGSSALRSALLDPAVNLLLQRLRGELLATRSRLEETQNELSAWKFTPDSNTGKRLMAKCRLLYQENEELGRMISSGRLAKLEGELALQKSFSDEVKKSQSELDEFLQDLDEDVEGMQSTIYYLQQELRKSKEANLALQQQKNNMPALEIINNSLTEKTSAQNPILKEQSTSTMEEVKLEPGLLPSKSPSSLSEPSSPHQVESSEKTDDALESAERQSEKVPEEGIIPNELVRVKEIIEENTSQSVVAIVSQETLENEKENIKDMKVNFELSCYSESDTIDETEKLREMDNNGKDGIKVEVDDQDSQGELMIEVGSEQGDSEGDVVDEEKCMEINKKADLSGINGLFKLSESGKNTKEEVDSDEERKKRPFPESNLSDEDSDDTPLIKKVRRNHDQAAKNKL